MERAGDLALKKEQQETIIECIDVNKTFEGQKTKTPVAEHFSLKVKKNEFVVLFGPGQCGKTTLLNMMAGLETASSGSIVVNQKKVKDPDPERGVVYQKTALFPWLTVMGNVSFGPRVRRLGKEEWKKKSQYFIDLVGLSGFENVYPVKLSGGMKQRVGIARAYCNDPAVLFMDEPFGHLDAQTRYLMQEEIERIWQSEKRTVVFVTNNIEEAIYLADRIVVLNNCPTSVKQEFTIDLPRPRNYVSREFLELRRRIDAVMERTR